MTHTRGAPVVTAAAATSTCGSAAPAPAPSRSSRTRRGAFQIVGGTGQPADPPRRRLDLSPHRPVRGRVPAGGYPVTGEGRMPEGSPKAPHRLRPAPHTPARNSPQGIGPPGSPRAQRAHPLVRRSSPVVCGGGLVRGQPRVSWGDDSPSDGRCLVAPVGYDARACSVEGTQPRPAGAPMPAAPAGFGVPGRKRVTRT